MTLPYQACQLMPECKTCRHDDSNGMERMQNNDADTGKVLYRLNELHATKVTCAFKSLEGAAVLAGDEQSPG